MAHLDRFCRVRASRLKAAACEQAATRPQWPHLMKDEPMTDTTLTLRAEHRFSQRLRRWLSSLGRHRTTAAHLETLSDHMLRDIGVERGQLDQLAIRTQHDAMRCSG